MKEAIAILTGGGPAPGMNTVVGSVAKTFLRKGYRVIGLHEGLYGPVQPLAPHRGHRLPDGRRHLQPGRFVPADEPFQTDGRRFRKQLQPQVLHRQQRETARDGRRRRHGLDGQPHRQVPRGEEIPHRQHPRAEDHRQRPAAAERHADVRLRVGQGQGCGHRPRRLCRCTHERQLVRAGSHGTFGRSPGIRHRRGVPLPDDRHSRNVRQDGDHRREDREPGHLVDHQA